MAITWPDVVAIAPQLATLPTATQDAILAAVALLTDPDTWEEKYDLGMTYLAAHLGQLYLNGQNGVAMPVGSEKVGEVSRKYEFPTNWKDALDTTLYGLTYKMILQRVLNAQLPLVC